MKRVPPSVRLKEEIEELLQGHERPSAPADPPMVGFVGRLARYMLQVAIEAEATAFLGRDHYRRGDRGSGSAGATATNRNRCRVRPACWSSRCPSARDRGS